MHNLRKSYDRFPRVAGITVGAIFLVGVLLLTARLTYVGAQRPSRPSRTDYQPTPNGAGNSTLTLSRPARPPRHSSCENCQLIAMDSTGRYLVNSYTGKPVFCTGEDGYVLLQQLSSSDADAYLADRQARGFNCLWIAVVDNYDQANAPNNYYGNAPFSGADFTNENSTYWNYIDTVLTDMSNRGMVAFLGTAFVGISSPGGYLSSILASSDATMISYGAWLGNRYKNYDNIVWVIGGDANTGQSGLYSKLADIAIGIQSTDSNHLITIEACRSCGGSNGNQSSLDAYSGTPPSWLGINWAYATQPNVVAACNNAYSATNYLPPIMGEDWYELEHSMTSFQVRQEGWWEATSGCTGGRLFGNSTIWSFNSPVYGYTPAWQTQLSSDGSIGEQYLGQLMRSREFWLCAPDVNHQVVTTNYGSGATLTTTCRTTDGQTIISYFSDGNASAKTVDMSKISSPSGQAKAWWYNPRTGAAAQIGTYPNSGSVSYTAPDGNDWALVIDDASASLSTPGQ